VFLQMAARSGGGCSNRLSALGFGLSVFGSFGFGRA
jgi:hypothetical protein